MAEVGWQYQTLDGKVIDVMEAPTSRTKAYLLRAAGGAMILGSWVPGILLHLEIRYSFIPVLSSVGVAISLFRLAQRYQTTSFGAALQSPQQPFLYLRSFLDDDRDSRQASRAKSFDESDLFTAEQALLAIFEKRGPCVAIGKPGEPIPAL